MKRKPQFAALCLAFALSLTVTGCGGVHISFGDSPKAEETAPEQKGNSALDMAAGKTNTQETQPSSNAPEPETPETPMPETPEPSEASEPSKTPESKPAGTAAASGNYIDYENRQFSVNGKTYTLGVNTLQDMIDDGVPFDANDIANAGNNLDANTESSGFGIPLGNYWTAQVYVINTTDSGKIMSECPLSAVYLPVHEDETQSVLSFAFPLDITEAELVASAGEPTNRDVYTDDNYENITVEYKKDSEKFFGSSGYEFEFTNGKLSYVNINWVE